MLADMASRGKLSESTLGFGSKIALNEHSFPDCRLMKIDYYRSHLLVTVKRTAQPVKECSTSAFSVWLLVLVDAV